VAENRIKNKRPDGRDDPVSIFSWGERTPRNLISTNFFFLKALEGNAGSFGEFKRKAN